MNNNCYIRRWIGICVLAISITSSSFIALADNGFESERWKNPEAKPCGERVGMVDDLLARYSLTEKSRAEIVTLLGLPEQTAYFSDWDMVYWLGSERGFAAIDSEWLVLRLGPQDRVLKVRVVSDWVRVLVADNRVLPAGDVAVCADVANKAHSALLVQGIEWVSEFLTLRPEPKIRRK